MDLMQSTNEESRPFPDDVCSFGVRIHSSRPPNFAGQANSSALQIKQANGEEIMPNAISYMNPADMAPPGGHYSHAVGAGGFVFVSGQLPITPDGKKLTGATFEQQAEQVLENVRRALIGAGSSVERVVQVRVYISDIELWPQFNSIYALWAGAARPARAVVPVPTLHYGLKLEVEAVAL